MLIAPKCFCTLRATSNECYRLYRYMYVAYVRMISRKTQLAVDQSAYFQSHLKNICSLLKREISTGDLFLHFRRKNILSLRFRWLINILNYVFEFLKFLVFKKKTWWSRPVLVYWWSEWLLEFFFSLVFEWSK